MMSETCVRPLATRNLDDRRALYQMLLSDAGLSIGSGPSLRAVESKITTALSARAPLLPKFHEEGSTAYRLFHGAR